MEMVSFSNTQSLACVAACDSFRSGAVEQLKRHCATLSVPLFSQGYDRDPVLIARAAIEQARLDGTDVVLVDTAGRMQNNGPLMQQLAKLVAVNEPDLVLFVGEVSADLLRRIRWHSAQQSLYFPCAGPRWQRWRFSAR